MVSQSLFKYLSHSDATATSDENPFEALVISSYQEEFLDSQLVARALFLGDIEQGESPWPFIEKWQEMLTLLLVLQKKSAIERYRPGLLERFRSLSAHFLWPEFQLFAAYRSLCAYLLGQPVKDFPVHQLSSGACPLDWGGRFSWGQSPHGYRHAELGLLWCLWGRITGDESCLTAAERLADWQCQTLDHDYSPFVGLFSQEEEVSHSTLLMNNYLLFYAVSLFRQRSDLKAIAEKQRQHFSDLSQAQVTQVSSFLLFLERWLQEFEGSERQGKEMSQTSPLPQIFSDPDVALVGYRSETTSVAATLSGGGTGMGCVRRGDVQIVSFGPQHLPLGDCLGFGIEGQKNHQLKTRICLSDDEKSFSVEGMVRMSPKPKLLASKATFRNGDHSGCWIDVRQSFKDECLTIETQFKGSFDVQQLAFAFFVKANACEVEAVKSVKLRSFDRYQGEVRGITLVGDEASLKIQAGSFDGEMQVIPLGGGDNFWGADFLVAYLFTPKHCNYSWVIR